MDKSKMKAAVKGVPTNEAAKQLLISAVTEHLLQAAGYTPAKAPALHSWLVIKYAEAELKEYARQVCEERGYPRNAVVASGYGSRESNFWRCMRAGYFQLAFEFLDGKSYRMAGRVKS